MKFETKAIHVGQGADPTTGATIVPIYQTSTYTQEDVGVHKGYDYSRTANPTRTALEQCLASLEGGQYGLAFASGVAATDATLKLLGAGDHVVVSDDVYGGTFRLFERVLSRYGITFSWVDAQNLENVKAAILPNTKLIWAETPTNPLLRLIDIKGLAGIAKEHNLLLAIDNTFASPYLQNPLALGADIVVHSTTKYLGGHSDVVGGAFVTNREDLYQAVKFVQNSIGAIPGPHDAFLTLRGIKTLALRMRQHCANAKQVASFLEAHPLVEHVYYPGLESHPQHELAKEQMRDFGGMVSFVVKGGLDVARTIAKSTELFSLAESLGGVESLLTHPPTMTHGAIPKEVRETRGVVDGLLRLSVGIEDAEDLLADLQQAFDKATKQAAIAH